MWGDVGRPAQELLDKAAKDHERELSLLRAECEAQVASVEEQRLLDARGVELEAVRREVDAEEATLRARARQQQQLREEVARATQAQQQVSHGVVHRYKACT